MTVRLALPDRRALLRWASGVSILALLGGAAFYAGLLLGQPKEPPFPPRSLVVAALNVGSGEASWIKTPDGRFVVVGAGTPESGASLVASLRYAGARRIDLLVLPYPYADALGGAVDIINAFPVQAALGTGWTRLNRKQAEVEELLKARRIPVTVARAGQSVPVGEGVLEVLAPGEPLVARTPAAGNNSMVVRLRWGGTAFLWCGGIEGPGEQALLSRASGRLAADWLRIPRFGNPSSTSPELLKAVSPRFAVVSVGANKDGLPAAGVLQRLAASGAEVLRTDALGKDLFFVSDGQRVTQVR